MSKIPNARRILLTLLDDPKVKPRHKKTIRRALKLMVRVRARRRAPGKRQIIGHATRKRVQRLLNTTDKSQHEIANVVGLRSAGRVSEISHKKR